MRKVVTIAAVVALAGGALVLGVAAASPADQYCKFIFDDPPPRCTFVERDVARSAVSIPALQFRFVSFRGSWSAKGTATGVYPTEPRRNWSYSFKAKSPRVVLRPTNRIKRAKGMIQLATSTTDPRYYASSRDRVKLPPVSGWVAGTVARDEQWTNVPQVDADPATGSCSEAVQWNRFAGVTPPDFVLLRRGRVKVEIDFGAPGHQCVTRKVHYTTAHEPPSSPYHFWLFRTIPVRALKQREVAMRWAGTKHETYRYDGVTEDGLDYTIHYSWDWTYAVTLVLRKA